MRCSWPPRAWRSEMLEIVSASASRLLTTRAEVKAELGITTNGADALVDTYVAAASDNVATYCARVFGKETVKETLRFTREQSTVILARVPVLTIASVTSDAGALVEGTGFECEKEAGLLYFLASDARANWSTAKLVVQYDTGFLLPDDANPTLPLDLRQAVTSLAAHYYRAKGRDANLTLESFQGIAEQRWQVASGSDAKGIPAELAAIIGRYRLPVVA